MGRRHGKNQTNHSVYSYQERQKDCKQSGFGNLNERIGKDSIKEFDCCSLTLQPCREPLCSTQGYLFDKEAVLEYIIKNKKENISRLKEWQKQREREQEQATLVSRAAEEEKRLKFVKQGMTPAHVTFDGPSDEQITSGSVSNMVGNRKRKLPSFWLPSEMKDADKNIGDKPDQNVYCPISHKKLRMKDLFVVNFTPLLNDELEDSNPTSKKRFMCPVTHDILTNVTPLCVLRTSGSVVTQECVDKLLKNDMIDPTNNEKMTQDDVIPLQRGGTGFAAVNKEKLQGKLIRPQIELQ